MEPPRAPPTPSELEFGGPWGAGALTLLLPLGLVGVVSASVGEGEGGWGTPALAFPTPPALALVLAWVGAHGLGSCWRPPRSPGDTPGPLRDLGWLLALGGGPGGALALGVPLPPLCPLLPPLAAAASSVAFGLGLLLLARRRLRGGGTGHPVYEFFVGGEAGSPLETPENLHWERVGLCAWLLVLAAALGEQQRLWGSPSLPLALVAAAQGVPVLRRLRELSGSSARGPSGFLGLFGALAWGPFGGPLPALLLLRRPQQGLGGAGGAACGGLYVLGLWIFHGATTQRSLFSRNPRDPRVAGLPTVPTATGQVLLAGGWWGLVRRPDDLGELLMALGWTLPCGLSPPLLLLLAGAALRELRALVGERRQRRRFGGAWGGLCQRVPHRLLPLVY
ncbi:LOW QUALITY PROTEIN: delta(14)-sterol reductase TM7SF2-like [Haemorhous mexicanus]|uniref:LOW QUALITY PROTEIN: delta(14)-sterol reductase TM7SF2-like n=1 Tax=Haemorhous mexicanus TaxID=30427 RepID=UPI0028BEBC02|nr:LOW QUALITY PROTEIN: delta(14)-sterol reductase TM7SF2-like [Haemorhous mexicanus]